MVGPVERFRANAAGVVSLVVLGAGLAALFAGIEFFWAIWVVGFAAVVPLVAMLFSEETDAEWTDATRGNTPDRDRENGHTTGSTDEALRALRERYARGELTDEQFERKVERLLETETVEDLEERTGRESVRERERT